MHANRCGINDNRRGMWNQKGWIAQTKHGSMIALLHLGSQQLRSLMMAVENHQARDTSAGESKGSTSRRSTRTKQDSSITSQRDTLTGTQLSDAMLVQCQQETLCIRIITV